MEKIELTKAIVNENEVRVECDHTSFANHKKAAPVDIKVLKSDLKKLTEKCKEFKVKLSKKNINSLLKESDSYLSEYDSYLKEYEEYSKLMKEVIEEGLYPPLVDNEKLNKAYKIHGKIDSMFWRSSILSKFQEIRQQINTYLFEDLDRYEKIYI